MTNGVGATFEYSWQAIDMPPLYHYAICMIVHITHMNDQGTLTTPSHPLSPPTPGAAPTWRGDIQRLGDQYRRCTSERSNVLVDTRNGRHNLRQRDLMAGVQHLIPQ